MRSANNRQIPSPVPDFTAAEHLLFADHVIYLLALLYVEVYFRVCQYTMKSMVGAVTGAKEHTFDVVNYSL